MKRINYYFILFLFQAEYRVAMGTKGFSTRRNLFQRNFLVPPILKLAKCFIRKKNFFYRCSCLIFSYLVQLMPNI